MSYEQEFYHLLNSSNLSLDLTKAPFTLLFLYPGVGVGKVFEDLAGCSKQLCQLASTKDRALKLGVQIAALSSVAEKPESGAIDLPIGTIAADIIPKDLLVTKEDQHFFARSAYLLYPDGKVERWIDPDGAKIINDGFKKVEQVYLKLIHTVTKDAMGKQNLNQCRVSILPTGADSLSALSVNLSKSYVLKRLQAENTLVETQYMLELNADENSIFPVIYAQRVFSSERWVVMDKLIPLTENSTPKLIERLSRFYLTHRSDVAVELDYHLYHRFFKILNSEDFSDTLKSLHLSKTDILMQTILVAQQKTSTIDILLNDLNELSPTVQAPIVSRIHGDLHWPNVLQNKEGEIKLIDPRLTWDGCFSIDGYFDPTYDLATLLHSSVLHTLNPSEILESNKASLVVTPRLIEVTEALELDLLHSISIHLPALIDDHSFVRKLRIFCANATFGWLKYSQIITTREQWNFYFGLTLYWLDKALNKQRDL